MSDFCKHAPSVQAITDYDQKCLNVYIRLIDADDLGVPWTEIYEQVFQEKIRPDQQYQEAQYHSHLRRARWMTTIGYRLLLGP